MTSAWSQLEQMLTCAICLDKFKNPRLLPCQHSFCGDACMDGLVDYARRQIKCPECRAEHRIPYQGVQSLPLNVTLIRFLELHARITGEEPEPVPTFMEKCSICGEKVEGVQRCSHCEKKVCPECKEAHIDLLRREISRLNGQTKRSLSKMQDFKETLKKSEEKLTINHATVRHEIEDSCKRLMQDLKAKQQSLLDQVDQFVEQEQKTIDRLKVALGDECDILSANLEIAEEKFIPTCESGSGCKLSWQDVELSELKDIYNRSMEFVRLFDPEIGDFTRKIRFTLIPEFDSLRKRICELGELKFAESAAQLIANSFQYCNASGQVALELCQQAQGQQQRQAADRLTGAGGYGLAHSNSNSNLGHQQFGAGTQQTLGSSTAGMSLELPNALMRSQSDHRLASQFNQRLKAQEMAAKSNGANGSATSGRYGTRANDYESDLRSRYAPPRGAKDYSSDLLRDWPRPSDNDGPEFGSSIHFKSAFMRRKEKERYAGSTGSTYGSALDDDEDLASEASYSTSGRNVRFYDQQQLQMGQEGPSAASKPQARQFETGEVEKAPLSGVPKLDGSPHYHNRLQQMGARSKVEKREVEEQGAKDKDLVESARQAMSKVAAKAMQQRQMSEDEIEKQKRANKLQEQQQEQQQLQTKQQQQTFQSNSSRAAGAGSSAASEPAASGSSSPARPTAVLPGARRSLYGQAVTERSKRQLSSAIQDAESYARRRSTTAAANESGEPSGGGSAEQPADGGQTGVAPTVTRRRLLRSGSRSLSKQSSSIERQQSTDSAGASPPIARRPRRPLAREDSSSVQTTSAERDATRTGIESKNLPSGSGASGASESRESSPAVQQQQQKQQRSYERRSAAATAAGQTPTTTDDDEEEDEDEKDEGTDQSTADNTGTIRRRAPPSRQSTAASSSTTPSTALSSAATLRLLASSNSKSQSQRTEDDELEETDDEEANEADEEEDQSRRTASARNVGNRRSREFLPSAVNRLLDRSAQIRRDSQEQRSRGDSPQRGSTTPTGSGAYAPSGATRASSTSSRQRYGFQQRSLDSSRRDSTGGGANEADSSNNSIYTTASSQATGGQRSSTDDSSEQLASVRRPSAGSSSERTVIDANDSARFSSRRDSGHNEPSAYQSRFLARSRTSAALTSGGSVSGSRASSLRSQDSDYHNQHLQQRERDLEASSREPVRSYLSSRDRFMQSASIVSGAGSSGASARDRTNSSGTGGVGSAGLPHAGPSATAPLSSSGPSTNKLSDDAPFGLRHRHRAPPVSAQSKAQVVRQSYRQSHNNSPFMNLDDDDDDDYDDMGAFMAQPMYRRQSSSFRR